MADPWEEIRKFTQARIGMGRRGGSLPTQEVLQLRMDHAYAKDAVHKPCNWEPLLQEIRRKGFFALECRSEAESREDYLRNPPKGKVLDQTSKEKVLERKKKPKGSIRLVLCFVDGLSATAIEESSLPLFQELLSLLQEYNVLEVFCVSQGRVAIGDQIAELSEADCCLVCIGERPGLSQANSLSIYFTWQPKLGYTDEKRNCISNIREGGLGFAEAVQKCRYLLAESRRLGTSGVLLKDRADSLLP